MGLEELVVPEKSFGRRALDKIVDLGKRWIKRAPRDCLNSTSLLLVATPVQAINDTFGMELWGYMAEAPNAVISMTNQASIQGKVGVAALTYAFAGPLFQICRDASKGKLGMTQKTNEIVQGIYDFAFTALYSSTVILGGYGYSYAMTGEFDKKSVGLALLISGISQVWRGPMIGMSIDMGQDIFGYRECDRLLYPNKVKNMSKKNKLRVYATAVVASLALTAGVYFSTPESWSNPQRLLERKEAVAQYQSEQKTNSTIVK